MRPFTRALGAALFIAGLGVLAYTCLQQYTLEPGYGRLLIWNGATAKNWPDTERRIADDLPTGLAGSTLCIIGTITAGVGAFAFTASSSTLRREALHVWNQ